MSLNVKPNDERFEILCYEYENGHISRDMFIFAANKALIPNEEILMELVRVKEIKNETPMG